MKSRNSVEAIDITSEKALEHAKSLRDDHEGIAKVARILSPITNILGGLMLGVSVYCAAKGLIEKDAIHAHAAANKDLINAGLEGVGAMLVLGGGQYFKEDGADHSRHAAAIDGAIVAHELRMSVEGAASQPEVATSETVA